MTPRVHRALSILAFARGRLDEEIDHLREVLATARGADLIRLEASLELRDALRAAQHPEEAARVEAALGRWIDGLPLQLELWALQTRAKQARRDDDNEAAFAFAKRALWLRPGSPTTEISTLAATFAIWGAPEYATKWDEEVLAYERARLGSWTWTTLHHAAHWAHLRGDLDRAARYVRRAAELGLTGPCSDGAVEAFEEIAEALASSGRIDDAREVYEAVAAVARRAHDSRAEERCRLAVAGLDDPASTEPHEPL